MSQNGVEHTLVGYAALTNQTRKHSNEGDGYILRLKKGEMKDAVMEDVAIYYYKGTKKTTIPENEAVHHVLPLKVLTQKMLLSRYTEDKKFQFIEDITSKTDVPEYSGYNTKLTRESGQSKKGRTTIMYTPIIDRKPVDHTTMLSAVKRAIYFTKKAVNRPYVGVS